MVKQGQVDDVLGNVLGMLADLSKKLQNRILLPSQLERFLKEKNPFDSIVTDKDKVLDVAVNRDRSIADGIAAGKYYSKHPDINDKNFPCTGSGTELIKIILVHFDKSMSTGDVLKELGERNLRPADLQELLAVGEQYPEEQRTCGIVALASEWDKEFPFLTGETWIHGHRNLSLIYPENGWHSFGWGFAAVPKYQC
ncbi:MAG: hypothetical protein WCT08_05100 [Patescibacteria group bacterium]|jgi:hypothetical protein